MVSLTSEQKQAVTTMEGNVCCIASAGSGKTSAFATRIAYMIKKGITPSTIMAITFTKKASEEMLKRLAKLVGKDKAKQVTIGTTHSVFLKLLKQYDMEFAKYGIIQDWQRMSWCKDLCDDFDGKKNLNGLGIGIKAGQLAGFISYQKSNLVKPNDPLIFDDVTDYVSSLDEDKLREAYKRYERLKSNSRQIDFDDMLMYMHTKLSVDENFRSIMQGLFEYIMVDEFQDSSKVVTAIIKMINDRNVFVVGDFRQSIYSFMNAKVENILNFHKEFNDVTTIELNKNFRSTQRIVQISNDIISLSPIESYRDYKMSESVAEEGQPVKMTAYQNEFVQVREIGSVIQQRIEEGIAPKEIAVLVRTNSQSGGLEEHLSALEIPYELSKTTSFFDKREIMDMLAYLKLVSDHDDNDSFRRVYNNPNRYLSKASLEKLEVEAKDKDISLWNASIPSPQNANWAFKKGVGTLRNIVSNGRDMIEDGSTIKEVLQYIFETTGYKKHIADTTSTHSATVEKEDAIKRLGEMSKKFNSIQLFLTNINIIKDKQKKAKGTDCVQLSTVHSAKGLEWDVVFVVDVNEGMFPHEFNSNIEEERRLFYVACSRPRKELYVSWVVFDDEGIIVKDSQFTEELVGKEELAEMRKEIFGQPSVTIEYQSKLK